MVIRHRPIGKRKRNTWRSSALLAAAFFIIILLHLTEISIWAAFYDFRGHFADFETGAYFFPGMLYDHWLRGRGAAAEVAAHGRPRGHHRHAALWTIHGFSFHDLERGFFRPAWA